jgi:transposase-like protein
MRESVCPPQRMGYSLESRSRIVQRILAGESPQAAAAAYGASRPTGYRRWRRYREGGWAALAGGRAEPFGARVARPTAPLLPVPAARRVGQLLEAHGVAHDGLCPERAARRAAAAP